jgi:hypothetical protein
MLADANGENECIDAAQSSSQHACIQRNTIGEVVQRDRRVLVRTPLELAHIIAQAGQAFQSLLMVK